jgi:hypothetical protein
LLIYCDMKDMGPDMVSNLYEVRFVGRPRCLYLVS